MPLAVGTQLDTLAGPLVALLALGFLMLVLRWAFGPSAPSRRPADDGLLTRVATLSQRETALALRAVLSDAGIRSTMRVPGAHRVEVLVFPEDAARARALAAAFPAAG